MMNKAIEDYINISNDINTRRSEFEQSIKDLTDAQKDYSAEIIAHAKDLLKMILNSSTSYFAKYAYQPYVIPYDMIKQVLGIYFDRPGLNLGIDIEYISSLDQNSITFYGHCNYFNNTDYGYISIPIELLEKNLTENDSYLVSVFETVEELQKDIHKQNRAYKIARLKKELARLESEE